MTSIHGINKKLLSEVCRLCLKEGNSMFSIFDEIESENSMTILAEKITSIARVDIDPGDGLPTSICQMCRRQVNQFHEFRLLVELSDKTLRSCLKSSQLSNDNAKMDRDIFEAIDGNEYNPVIEEDADAFCAKTMMNYAILVPTTEGLQVWKLNDLEQSQELDKLMRADPVNKSSDESKRPLVTSAITKSPENLNQLQQQRQQQTYSIRICETEGLDDNEQFVNAEIMSCQLCFSEFESLEDLKKHIIEHCVSLESDGQDQENTVNNHQKTPYQNNLLAEMYDESDDANQQNPLSLEANKAAKKSQRSKLFKCRYCNKLFGKMLLKKHYEKCQTREMQLICNVCGKQFMKKSELRYHKGTHLTSPLMCSTCNKFFRNVQSFKMHMKRHTLGSRYNCVTCGQSYYTNSELARHVQKHEDKRKYPCHLCDTSFLSKPELNRHMKYHNGVKKFECNLCYKSYYESGHLKVHQRVHTGERPFVCQVCNKGFVTRSKLARHSKIHKKEIER